VNIAPPRLACSSAGLVGGEAHRGWAGWRTSPVRRDVAPNLAWSARRKHGCVGDLHQAHRTAATRAGHDVGREHPLLQPRPWVSRGLLAISSSSVASPSSDNGIWVGSVGTEHGPGTTLQELKTGPSVSGARFGVGPGRSAAARHSDTTARAVGGRGSAESLVGLPRYIMDILVGAGTELMQAQLAVVAPHVHAIGPVAPATGDSQVARRLGGVRRVPRACAGSRHIAPALVRRQV
jgi:hypothetical protein